MDFCSIPKQPDHTLSDIDIELQTYFDQPRLKQVNPIKYWTERKTIPLSILALQVLAVLCSSAPVERLFSKAGLVLGQQ